MLSKKYNFHESEKKWQDFWKDNNIYKYNFHREKETFSIDTPPPTVSGSLHIGHIFSYTQAEIIARYERMQGKNVFYPFGFDDNGLPTERLVEKERGIKAVNMPRSEFTKICLETASKYEEKFKELWMSMGFSTDWSLKYSTIDKNVQRISQKAFMDMAKCGKAYMKESPVLWCTTCQTSIAQAELETIECESVFNYIPFTCENEEIIVATTRPELLYGCVCLFINPKDKRYEKFKGKKVKVPLYGFEIPILEDEKVSMDKGTGAVMCATFGDITDVEWYEKYNLPYKRVILKDGSISPEVPFISNLKVKAARKKIIEILKENNLLIKSENIMHNVSVHERCKEPIEIIPSTQWYINILSEKEKYLKAADEINWHPDSMKIRYINWVENLKWDWCISRQRYFGIPFPIWYCKKCGKVYYAEEESLPVNPLEDSPKKPCSCGSHEFIPETAVLDTWATSSLSPLINGRWKTKEDITEKLIPMGMRTQAHEIIRTWAFYSIVRSLYHLGIIPWKDIMICGYVLAKKGEKISKSKNNGTFSPEALISNNSADALRYWSAGAKLGTDTMFSEADLKISKRFLTKLWNAGSFTIMQLGGYKKKKPETLLPVDLWIINKALETEKIAKGYLDNYEIGLARQAVDEFFWKDYCDFYLEIVKDRLYKPELHGENERRSAQYALYKVYLEILKMYSIYVPHITEEIYHGYFIDFEKESSIHLLTWEKTIKIKDEKILSFGEDLKYIIGEVRKFKTSNNFSMKEEIELLKLIVPKALEEFIKITLKDIKACTSSKSIEVIEGSSLKIEILK